MTFVDTAAIPTTINNDNNNINGLLISNDKYLYYFEGNIELNELIKIYKNLKIF